MEEKRKRKKPAYQVRAAEIKEKAKRFCADRKSANHFVDVLAEVAEVVAKGEGGGRGGGAGDGSSGKDAEADVATLLAGISAILKMTTHVIDNRFATLTGGGGATSSATANDGKISADAAYSDWLRLRLDDASALLLSLIEESSNPPSVREAALVAFVKILANDGRVRHRTASTSPSTKKVKHFVNEKAFNSLVRTLLSSYHDVTPVLARFAEYVEKVDVVHCLLLQLLDRVKHTEKDSASSTGNEQQPVLDRAYNVVRNETYWNNFFGVLEMIKMRDAGEEMEEEWLVSLTETMETPSIVDEGEPVKAAFPENRRLFSSLWTEFLRSPLPPSIFKKSLVLLADQVMPFMTSPLALTDFLIKSYDMGGVVSILALNGIFILVHRYNLEYPHFYKKLYSLLTDGTIFGAKYRSRFFFLVDLFLTSTHIPAYLVCAFVKRLSRLALVAPPNGILIILTIIRNLLLKHTNAQILVHCPDGATCLDEDPYLDCEEDPSLCCAMESSLWEVASLQNHYYPRVAKMAKALITQPIAGLEQDLSQVLEETEDDIFTKECNSKFHHVAVNHLAPKGLFDSNDASATKCWATVEDTMEM